MAALVVALVMAVAVMASVILAVAMEAEEVVLKAAEAATKEAARRQRQRVHRAWC
jgi:hypothetical protein